MLPKLKKKHTDGADDVDDWPMTKKGQTGAGWGLPGWQRGLPRRQPLESHQQSLERTLSNPQASLMCQKVSQISSMTKF